MSISDISNNELVLKLNAFYSNIERLLTTRVSPNNTDHPLKVQGAKSAYDSWLRAIAADELVAIFPDAEIFWDDQIGIKPKGNSDRSVLVDLVDGSNEYHRDGSSVTSHLGLYKGKSFELGIISYPFHNFRIMGIKGEGLFYLPYTFRNSDANGLHYNKLSPHRNKKIDNFFGLSIIDRYSGFNTSNPIRSRLDNFRLEMEYHSGKYSIPRGSVAKNIVDVALGRGADVTICKHTVDGSKLVPAHDYLTPSKLLEMIGGVFTDLNGNKPDGINPIDGFIAAKNRATFDIFFREIVSNGDKAAHL